MANGDKLVFSSQLPATVTVNGNVSTDNAEINKSGTASNVSFVVTGSFTTAYQANVNANVQAGSVNDSGGNVVFGGTVTATSGNIVLGYKTTAGGNVSSSTGSITLGNEAVISGGVSSSSGGAISIKYKSQINGSVTTTGAITIENESVINGSISGGTGAINVQYRAQVTGSVTSSSGTILMDNETVAGACVKSTGSAAITLNYRASINSVCCGSSCGNSCVTNNTSLAMPAACAPSQTCITDNFSTGTLDTSLWNALTLSGSFTPQVVTVGSQNRLRLTDARGSEATMVQLKKWFPAAGNKVVVQFDYSVYNGTGADGVVVVFSDAGISPAPGGAGGSLGYAQSDSTAGFSGGWLGVGIDEYGNFPNTNQNRQTYPSGWTAPTGANTSAGFYPNSVAVRGSGSGTTGYKLLANTGTVSPVIWNRSSTSSTVQRFRITIDNSNNVNAYVTLERDTTATGNSFTTLIPKFDVLGTNSGQAAVPTNLLLSLTGGTGGSTNIHELTNLSVCATYVTDPGSSTAAAAFDCLETGTNVPWVATTSSTVRPLYTKLAATNFTFDIAALKSDGTLESNYVAAGANSKYVLAELFDNTSPAASCSAYSSPVASQIVTFASGTFSGAAGRTKTPNFTVPSARAKLICRVKECTSSTCSAFTAVSPACSTDQFSVRPQQFTVTAPAMSNTALTGTPAAKAGTAFTLTAAAGVTAGYTGTPTIDSTKVLDHNGVTIAANTLSGSFSAGTGTGATGTSFTYQDVGNIQFPADTVVDSSFTAIDQSNNGCVTGSTSNTLSGGKYGCNIGSPATAKFGRWYPSHYSFSGALTASCAAGGFTYMDQDALGVVLTLKAHATTGGAASASDPVLSRYTSGYSRLAPVTISGDNGGTAVAVSRLGSPAFPAMPNTALWSAGQMLINDTYAFSKLASPDGPYDSFKLKAAISDPDGATFLSATNETNTTRVRYGQMRLFNTYGSELLALPVPLEARYWNGSFYVTNTLDSCTTLNLSSVIMSNYVSNLPTGLAACETQISPTTNQTLNGGKLLSPGLVLSKPGAGNSGSVLLTLNVSATATGKTCVSTTESNATAANLPWFGSNPTARATFGVYKSPLIYLRENY
ncbi:DUF6701 domain-containing protein [Rhodoferax bucti]|uniref:DUF6701 domain-containing protein n=1 Tax=Rhodoferax bucti TaxID=2576305 RepID=UPI00110829E6|nr:DUF6701 domain-containing protein [Rhodoferax bucti]